MNERYDICAECGMNCADRYHPYEFCVLYKAGIDPEKFVRRALDLALSRRPGIGEGWLFPAPRKRGAHVSRSVADSWLREAERAAGLTHLPGTLWHAYRRGWATARKHLPATDVAHAGGWANARTLQTVYQQPDQVTLERVVLEAVELREKR